MHRSITALTTGDVSEPWTVNNPTPEGDSSDLSSAELANEAKDFSIPVVSTSESEFSDLEEIIQGYRAAPIEAFALYEALCLVPPNPYH